MFSHKVSCLFLIAYFAIVYSQQELPPYVKQCREDDPLLADCIIKAIDHLRPYLKTGIPEIQLPAVEPFKIDSLSLALTNGPNGYKITLRDIDAFGASNFQISKIKLRNGNAPFEVKIKIPKMVLDAKYTSTGILIVIPANGNGTFHAELGDVMAIGKGIMSSTFRDGQEFFKLDRLDIDLDIKDVKMHVRKIFNNNRILVEATNLFLRENGQEVLKVMMPQLRVKLINIFMDIINQLLKNVPAKMIYIRSNPTTTTTTTTSAPLLSSTSNSTHNHSS
ncbi:uncharacterized protein Jhbp1 [Planococcus citri]|uniref:uncharacterized protein Jhbp1 n=1 Tax=Planococcus citri TaxID=170843 RepID=UPI0031F8F110